MSEALIIDWLNENELRAYPLKPNAILDHKIVLDASLVFTEGSPIGTPKVLAPLDTVLTSVTVSGDNVTFLVTAAANTISFTFDRTAVSYPCYCYVDCSLLVVGQAVLQLASTGTINLAFEPSVVYDMRVKWNGVSSIIGRNASDNVDKTLTNSVTWAEGYQFGVNIVDEHNIKLSAGKQYGLTIPCGTNLFNYPNDCSNILSFINGATTISNPGRFTLSSDGNIKILEDPANHRIFIGLNFGANDICKNIVNITTTTTSTTTHP